MKDLQKQAAADLALVADIDQKLSAMGGTISAKLKAAREAVGENPVLVSDVASVLLEVLTAQETVDIDTLNEQASLFAEAVKQATDEAIAAHLSKDKDANKDAADTLKTQRADAVDRLKAFATIGLIDQSQVPKSGPKVRTSGTGGGGKVKVSNIRYYRIKDGERTDQKDSQNSFSSLAWYYSKNADGERMSAGDLALLVKNETGKDPYSEAFTFDVGNGYTIGADVVEQVEQS